MEKNTSKEDLLKAVADVLDEALAEYEKLAKMEDMEAVEDPSRPGKSLEKDAPVLDPAGVASIKGAFGGGSDTSKAESPDMAEEKDEAESEEEAPEAEEGEEKEEAEDKDGDEEDEMDDETLKSRYAKMCAKMEARGLMKKSEAKKEEVKKSEAAAEDKTESLRKSVDERFDALTKAIADIAATVGKIASAPARKGVAGYQPLRKSEEGSEAQPLNKAEVISKLLDLKKSGKYVDTALINRIETGRTSEADAQTVKQLLG